MDCIDLHDPVVFQDWPTISISLSNPYFGMDFFIAFRRLSPVGQLISGSYLLSLTVPINRHTLSVFSVDLCCNNSKLIIDIAFQFALIFSGIPILSTIIITKLSHCRSLPEGLLCSRSRVWYQEKHV